MKVLIATRNIHKLQEIQHLLGIESLTLCSALDYPDIPDVLEDGSTFEANAILKARAFCDATGLPTLADDSGLAVDALDGAPGIYSARYAGMHGDDAANNRTLLKHLEGIKNRKARFVCAIARALPDGGDETVRGTCEGKIVHHVRGTNGFGYDSIFIPDGYDKTFGELAPAIKSSLSHRANALRLVQKEWAAFFR